MRAHELRREGYEKGYADAEAKLEVKLAEALQHNNPASYSSMVYWREKCYEARAEVERLRKALKHYESVHIRPEFGWRGELAAAQAEVERLRAALGNELSDDSPERHTYSTCIAGEGDQVNADRGCQRCAAWLTLRGEGEK